MGSVQSGPTRTIRVENKNESPFNVINISDDVAKRLQSQVNKSRESKAVQQENQPPVTPELPNSTVSSNLPVYHPPSVTHLEWQREKENELTKSDEYWRKRVRELEKSSEYTASVMEREYIDTIENVKNRFHTPSQRGPVIACQEQKKKILECYKQHRNILYCADAVNDFSNCVNHRRISLVDEKIKN